MLLRYLFSSNRKFVIDNLRINHKISYQSCLYRTCVINKIKNPHVPIIVRNLTCNKILSRYYSSSSSGGNANGNQNDDGGGPKKPNNDDFRLLLSKIFALSFLVYFFSSFNQRKKVKPENSQHISWNEFVHYMLAKGEVERVMIFTSFNYVMITLHPGAIVKGKRTLSRVYFVSVSDVEKFEDKLRDVEKRMGIKDGVPVVYSRSGAWGKFIGPIVLTLLAMYLMLSRKTTMRGSFNMQSLTQIGRAKFTLIDPLTKKHKGVRFSDVAGLKQAKIEVMEFVDYLKSPERFHKLGAKIPTGALLLGPPGCGKTLLAKALATESSVPFLSMNGSEFVEMLGGLGAARVRDLFKEARKRAPCIVYIDEIDAIGKKRSHSIGHSENEQTLNQLLVEMDGMSSRKNVIILASTNREDVLDKALLRPGRFDRHILIDLPDLEERQQIFEVHLKSIVLDKPISNYTRHLSELTPGFSGADIANVCNEAALHAASSKKKMVTKEDLDYAIERTIGGTEKRSHALSSKERRVVAYHESGHALVSWMLEHTDTLLKITIIPRTTLALGFAQYIPRDQKLFSKEELFDKMCVMMGGRVAESIVFNRITTGAQNDLKKITDLAYSQIREHGMSNVVGLISFNNEEIKSRRHKPFSKNLSALIDQEVRKLLSEVYKKTEFILKENRDKLEILAENLLKKETLTCEQVKDLIGPPAFHKKKNVEEQFLNNHIS